MDVFADCYAYVLLDVERIQWNSRIAILKMRLEKISAEGFYDIYNEPVIVYNRFDVENFVSFNS